MNHAPYLLPWVRVPLLIRSITSTTWGHEAWPEVKPMLRRALQMRRQIAREGWWNWTVVVATYLEHQGARDKSEQYAGIGESASRGGQLAGAAQRLNPLHATWTQPWPR